MEQIHLVRPRRECFCVEAGVMLALLFHCFECERHYAIDRLVLVRLEGVFAFARNTSTSCGVHVPLIRVLQSKSLPRHKATMRRAQTKRCANDLFDEEAIIPPRLFACVSTSSEHIHQRAFIDLK